MKHIPHVEKNQHNWVKRTIFIHF